jgi:hypothetical protein
MEVPDIIWGLQFRNTVIQCSVDHRNTVINDRMTMSLRGKTKFFVHLDWTFKGVRVACHCSAPTSILLLFKTNHFFQISTLPTLILNPNFISFKPKSTFLLYP